MTHMKQSLLALIIALAIFYNLGRLDWGTPSQVNISVALYVVGFVAVAVTIYLPPLRRIPRYVQMLYWLAFYAAIRLVTWQTLGIRDNINSYIIIAEVACLLLLIFLAQNVGQNLDEFETAVSNLTLAGAASRVQSLAEAQTDIQKELLRSRRLHSPISVIVLMPHKKSLEINLNQAIYDIQRNMLAHYVNTAMLRIAGHIVRRTDLLVNRPEESCFIVISPDTDAAHADSLAQRIQAAVQKEMGVQVLYGLATFPDEEANFDELLQRACDRVGRPCETHPPAPAA